MDKQRHEKNEKILQHLERLNNIRTAMTVVQPGLSPSTYDANEVVEAMKRLAREISTEPLGEAF